MNGRNKECQKKKTKKNAHTANSLGECPAIIQISRTHRHWKFYPAPSQSPAIRERYIDKYLSQKAKNMDDDGAAAKLKHINKSRY